MRLTLRSALVTDPGLVRSTNEDSAYAGRRLFAVADGMGGLPAGEVASEIVIRALRPLDEQDTGSADTAQHALRSALETANQQIRSAVRTDPARTGMGTTLTALLAVADRIAVLHVGDSRAYLYRDHTLVQLTTDDTFVQMLVDQGALTEAEAFQHPQRYLVTRAVQGTESISPAFGLVRPRSGDRFLVCSDGLSDYLAPAQIQATLGVDGLSQCARALVDLVLQAGAPDNVTAIVVDVQVG